MALLAPAIALAQTTPTYTLETPSGTLASIQSDSGLAVVCTFYQPVKFVSMGIENGWEWGRFVEDGTSLVGTDAALHGPYLPSRSVGSRNVWSFGEVDASFAEPVQAVYPGEAANLSPTVQAGWIADHLYLDISNSIWRNNTAHANPDQLGSARAWPEQPKLNLDFATQLTAGTPRVVKGVIDEPAPGFTDRYYRRLAEGGETWAFVSTTALTKPSFPSQDPIHVWTVEITADPFKGGDSGGGSFDPSGIINAIVAQTNMQEAYFNTWSSIFANMDANISGELYGQNWEQRDKTRNDHLAIISSRTGSLLSSVSQLNSYANQILQAIQPTQVPPTLAGLGENTPTPELLIDPVEQIPTVDEVRPDGFDLPGAPPDPSGPPVWNFTLPLGSIPMMQDAFGDQQFSVDLSSWATFVQSIHSLVILMFTLFMFFAVMAETEKS